MVTREQEIKSACVSRFAEVHRDPNDIADALMEAIELAIRETARECYRLAKWPEPGDLEEIRRAFPGAFEEE